MLRTADWMLWRRMNDAKTCDNEYIVHGVVVPTSPTSKKQLRVVVSRVPIVGTETLVHPLIVFIQRRQRQHLLSEWRRYYAHSAVD